MRTQIVCCRGQAEIRKLLRVRPRLYSWVDEMDADLGCGPVRPLNAVIIALKLMAALMRSARDRVVVRVKEMKQCGVCALSDVLQDVKDELHHYRLLAPLAAPAVNDSVQHAVQGVEILSWEGLPVAPSHKSHL